MIKKMLRAVSRVVYYRIIRKTDTGLANLNPYLGGNEAASVNLHGNTDNPVGVSGDGDTTGPGGGPVGNGGKAK